MMTGKQERSWHWLGAILAAVFWTAPSLAANPADVEKLKTEMTCERCDLQGADLRSIKRFDEGKLFMCQSCDLRGADLRGMNLSNAFLWHADLTGANLEGTILTGAIMRGVVAQNAKMSGANLEYANVYSAVLSGADLSKANLNMAYMRGSRFSDAKLVGAQMSGTDLTGANLDEAFVESSDLREAKLCRTTLSGNRIENRNCSETDQPATGEEPSSGQETATLAAGCELRGQIVSTSENQLATVNFTNGKSSAIHVYWISYEGSEGDYESKPQPLISLEAGQSQSIQAHIGYAFSVFDGTPNCLGVARVEKEANEFAYR